MVGKMLYKSIYILLYSAYVCVHDSASDACHNKVLAFLLLKHFESYLWSTRIYHCKVKKKFKKTLP